MAFAWRGLELAHDPQQRITVQQVHRFDDVGPEGPHRYLYSEGELTFEFHAMTHHDWRIWNSFAEKSLSQTCITVYILENSVKDGLPRARYNSLSSQEYQALRQNIRDGMLALCSQGGEKFRHVPDFRVEFAESGGDVPKPKPRLLSLDNLIEQGSYDSSLSLASLPDHANISFIYKSCSAEDVESGVTITGIRRFEEIGLDAPLPYLFSKGDLEFEFRASTYREWQTDRGKLTRPHTATYVIKETIDRALRSNGIALNSDEHRTIMESIRAGMWAIEGSGARLPGFEVKFVDRAEDAPKWPVRSANPKIA